MADRAQSHKAPLTLALIVQINNLLASRRITNEKFRRMLNRHLPSSRQINGDHPGIVKLNRWLNPTSKGWPEPMGEIVLAMQAVLKEFSTNSLTTRK